MSFAAQAFLLPVEDGVDGGLVNFVLRSECADGDALSFKALARCLAGLLRGVCVGHSSQTCDLE